MTRSHCPACEHLLEQPFCDGWHCDNCGDDYVKCPHCDGLSVESEMLSETYDSGVELTMCGECASHCSECGFTKLLCADGNGLCRGCYAAWERRYDVREVA